MDLQTRDRADENVAAVSDREPDVPQARGRGAPGASAPGTVALGAAAILIACSVGLAIALGAGVAGVSAVPAVLRTAAVGTALFALCGYAVASRIVGGELAADRALFVLPLGAVVSSLVLAVLGILHVPLKVSLAALIGAAALAALAERRSAKQRRGAASSSAASGDAGARTRAPRAQEWRPALARVALPLLLAAMVGLISLVPTFRSGFATVPGQNGDAILVVGSAVLLEHAPPTATRTDLPINHIPLVWRSKYPIYYPLAAIAALAGQDPIAAFPTVVALMLALTALGFFLFARHVLRAPPWVALLAMFLVPLDRIVMYVTIHPYYNELWGQFALPFILLAGWRLLVAPDRRVAALLACFGVLGLLAYPLMFPFPLFFLGGGAWTLLRVRGAQGGRRGPRRAAALLLLRIRQRPWLTLTIVVIAVPVALVLVRGFFEKTLSAAAVLAPWTSLAGWGSGALPFLPWPHFFGMPGTSVVNYVGLLAVCALAVLALAQMRPQARFALGAMIGATALIAIYFRLRTDGELFFFKDLAFLGPYVLMLALVALGLLVRAAARRAAVLGLAGIAAALVIVPLSSAREIDGTYDNATLQVLQLRSWSHQLPRAASVRIDVPPSGLQVWATYMFNGHPMSTLDPLGAIFPHPPRGRKATYVVALSLQPRPADAVGEPLLRNAQFVLWRMNPAVPGPDRSSRRLLDDVSSVTIPIG